MQERFDETITMRERLRALPRAAQTAKWAIHHGVGSVQSPLTPGARIFRTVRLQ